MVTITKEDGGNGEGRRQCEAGDGGYQVECGRSGFHVTSSPQRILCAVNAGASRSVLPHSGLSCSDDRLGSVARMQLVKMLETWLRTVVWLAGLRAIRPAGGSDVIPEASCRRRWEATMWLVAVRTRSYRLVGDRHVAE